MKSGTVFTGGPVTKDEQVAGHYEPSLTHRFLPGCRTCGTRHPAAFNPPMDEEFCPGCGAAVANPGEEVSVPAALTDWRARFGNALVRAGSAINRLSKRF